jgi:hypothetical protein
MIVAVSRGTLQWTAGGVAQLVQGGQAITVSGTNLIQVASTGLPAPDAFDQWSADRDRKLASSPSAQYVSRGTPGVADLDDNGSWQTDAQDGPVWYPSGVQADWAPYRYGRWVWIEPWGWNWVEQEPWGYAPFHYGRWAFVGSRWGWLPGSVVARPYYAPALVVFVDGSGFQAGAQAWFPLGPGEPYRPWYHSGDSYQRRMNVATFGRVPNITVAANVNTIEYRNRRLAMTVVPTTTFRGGLPIARRAIPVTQEQIARAPIAPHPFASPGAGAAAGGGATRASPRGLRPGFVVAPTPRQGPLVQARQPLIVRQEMPAQRPAPPFQARQPMAGRQEMPAPRPGAPAQANQPMPGRRDLPAPVAPPVLITRHAPPPQVPPFPVRQQAMQPDVGRPLEPQQINNLRAGRPAGARRDPEIPPHPVAAQAAPAPRQPAAAQAPPARQQPSAAQVQRGPQRPAAAPARPGGPAPKQAKRPPKEPQP